MRSGEEREKMQREIDVLAEALKEARTTNIMLLAEKVWCAACAYFMLTCSYACKQVFSGVSVCLEWVGCWYISQV